MTKHKITMADGTTQETTRVPVKVEKLDVTFTCNGKPFDTYELAQAEQIAVSPRNAEGAIIELVAIIESQTTIDTKELVW